MTKKPAGKALAPSKSKNLPAKGDDEFYSGSKKPRGLENVTAADLIMPRITIIQALSPQLQKSKPEFIKGAKAGQFCDTAGKLTWDDELELICCHYARVHLEWAPRGGKKSGLVANHGIDPSVMKRTQRDERNRAVLPNGNYIAETMTFFCLNVNDNGKECFVPMTSTQMKAARLWIQLMQGIRLETSAGVPFVPDCYYQSYVANVVEQSNNDGEWFGWNMTAGTKTLELDPTRDLLERAKAFNAVASIGLSRGDYDKAMEQHAEERSDDPDGAM